MTARATISSTRLFFSMAIHVLIGIPLVAYLWETLNELLALHPDPIGLLVALPLLIVFAALLSVLARRVRWWQTVDFDNH
jgi:hypothetical protein